MTASFDSITNPLSRRRFLGALGASAGAVALPSLLAACGTGSGTPNAAPAGGGSPKPGGTLRVGLVGGSVKDTLDAERAVTEADMARSIQLYDTLLEYDPDFKRQSALAEEVQGSPDAKEWTIRLRDGVEFHNGKTVSAADVIYTLLLVTDPKNPGSAAARLATMDRGSLQALDKRTVRVRFTQGYSPFADALADVGTSAIRVVPEGYDLKNPVGSGPFKFESFTPGERSVFKKHPNYWRNGEPFVDELILINLTDDSARVNALLSGQVDAIAGLPNSQTQIIKNNKQLALLNSATGGWNPITMRIDAAPFDDPRVRQAFRLLVDRQQMVDQVLAGQGTPANDLFGRYDPTYNSGLAQRKADVEQAKSLLRAAGKADLEVELVTSAVAGGLVEAAQAFSQQASKAGVKVKVLKVDPSTFFSKYFCTAPFSQSYWGTRNYLLQVGDSMLANSPYNETHWKHDEWAKLVDQAFKTTDEAARSELVHKAQNIEHNEGGYINWGWYNKFDAYHSRVNGFVPDKSGFSLTSYRLRKVWMA